MRRPRQFNPKGGLVLRAFTPSTHPRFLVVVFPKTPEIKSTQNLIKFAKISIVFGREGEGEPKEKKKKKKKGKKKGRRSIKSYLAEMPRNFRTKRTRLVNAGICKNFRTWKRETNLTIVRYETNRNGKNHIPRTVAFPTLQPALFHRRRRRRRRSPPVTVDISAGKNAHRFTYSITHSNPHRAIHFSKRTLKICFLPLSLRHSIN